MSEVPLDNGGAWGVLLKEGISVYRGYSKLRTRTAVGSYRRASPRSVGPP